MPNVQSLSLDRHGHISLIFSTAPLNCLVKYARGAQASPAMYLYIFDPAAYALPQKKFLSLGYSKLSGSAPSLLFWQGEPLPPAPAAIDTQRSDYRGNALAQWSKMLLQQFASPHCPLFPSA